MIRCQANGRYSRVRNLCTGNKSAINKENYTGKVDSTGLDPTFQVALNFINIVPLECRFDLLPRIVKFCVRNTLIVMIFVFLATENFILISLQKFLAEFPRFQTATSFMGPHLLLEAKLVSLVPRDSPW